MAKRRGEFSEATKELARRRAGYACEVCGKKGYTEVHHLLGLAIASKHYPSIAPAILASLENAMCVCKKCHKEMDKKAKRHHRKYAEALRKAVGDQMRLGLR